MKNKYHNLMLQIRKALDYHQAALELAKENQCSLSAILKLEKANDILLKLVIDYEKEKTK